MNNTDTETIENYTQVQLIDGRAEVRANGHHLTISRRDLPDELYTCPVELVAAALGS